MTKPSREVDKGERIKAGKTCERQESEEECGDYDTIAGAVNCSVSDSDVVVRYSVISLLIAVA